LGSKDSPPDQESTQESESKKWYDLGVFKDFDKSFLILMTVLRINYGFATLMFISIKQLFKNEYGLDPISSQYWHSVITFPWTLKIFYGILSDNIPIMGSRKKSYIIGFSLIQFVLLQTAFWSSTSNVVFISILMMVVSLTQAFIEVVFDGILVI